MITIKNGNISMTRGDTASFLISCIDSYGQPHNLVTGDTLKFTIKKSANTLDIILQKTVTTFSSGKATVTLAATDTSTIAFGSYVYDIQVQLVDGTVSTIIPVSRFDILGEVT
jgi:hypothetical protein